MARKKASKKPPRKTAPKKAAPRKRAAHQGDIPGTRTKAIPKLDAELETLKDWDETFAEAAREIQARTKTVLDLMGEHGLTTYQNGSIVAKAETTPEAIKLKRKRIEPVEASA